MADDGADAQLAIIAEVTEMLAAAGIEFWLWGGWGVDFLIGRVTRPHQDVELIVWERAREQLKVLLGEHGFELVDDRAEDVISRKNGHLVEFYVVKRREDGRIVTPEKWERWPWPEDAFSGEVGRVGKVAFRVVSAAAQLDACAPRRSLNQGDDAFVALSGVSITARGGRGQARATFGVWAAALRGISRQATPADP